MTSMPELEPREHEMPPGIISAQVKTDVTDSSETITVEVRLSQDSWDRLQEIFGEHKWGDDEGLVALVAAGLAVLQVEKTSDKDKSPDQAIRRLRNRLAGLEAEREVLRNRVGRLHVLEWRDLPLARQQLGDYKALILRLREEIDALQAENTRLRGQLNEDGESLTQP